MPLQGYCETCMMIIEIYDVRIMCIDCNKPVHWKCALYWIGGNKCIRCSKIEIEKYRKAIERLEKRAKVVLD